MWLDTINGKCQNKTYIHIDDVHVCTFEAVDTRFLFRAGAADAAIVKAFMNPALSMATAGEKKK